MKKRTLATIAILTVAFAMLGTGIALATSAPQPIPVANYCVTFGHGPTAAGNTVEFNWDHSQCPANSYPHEILGPVTSRSDNDPYLGSVFFVGKDGSAFPPSHFNIVDDANAPGTVVTYNCQLTAPTTSDATPSPTSIYTPGIACTKG